MALLFFLLLLTLCAEQADSQVSTSPATEYAVAVTADFTPPFGPGVSRMITTNDNVPGRPYDLKGSAVGSFGIMLSWKMPNSTPGEIKSFVIRYKEVCPFPDVAFTQIVRSIDVDPFETMINHLTPGGTFQIEVAATSLAGIGPFSKTLYQQTAESPPGEVSKLSVDVKNSSYAVATFFLPRRINGLITKFRVRSLYFMTTEVVDILEINAEDIMTEALPHCNDAAEILSRATLSPLDMTASSTPITLSAVPPAASWNVPISVGLDLPRPFTGYSVEVTAFNAEGEGMTAPYYFRSKESAPEDEPQNFEVQNMTSRWILVSWSSPSIVTGKFTYVVNLYGPTGGYENSTGEMRFAFTGLIPFTSYTVTVRAKAGGEVGPAVQENVTTLAEAPSAVQDLMAIAEDSVSIRVSWKVPAQPNGPITQYRLQVLDNETLLQDITLTEENTSDFFNNETPPPNVSNAAGLRKRSAELSAVTSPATFTATLSDRTLSSDITSSSFTHSNHITSTDFEPTGDPTLTETPVTSYTYDTLDSGTSTSSLHPVPPATLSPWLTRQTPPWDLTSDSSSMTLTPSHARMSTRDASHISTRSATSSGTTGVTVREEVMDVFTEDLSYLVSELNYFTEYTFMVTASTTEGEGPASNITEKTKKHVPSSVLEVSYQNISSTSIQVNWMPPLIRNGQITHYTVYGIKLHNNQALNWFTNTTSILITDLDKYTGYKLRVAASTATGESELSEEDYIFVYTMEDEPDSPPVNLTVVETTASTITLTWSPPEKANGVISQYEVLYESGSFSSSVFTTTDRVTLTDVKPYSYYNISVRAYTLYGHGNQTSDVLNILSGEDVPGGPPYDLSYQPINPSEVNVTWLSPLLPNGIITHYSLQFWNSSSSLNLTSPTTYIHITHLRKYAQYRARVQAHTRVGSGNYSEPLNITTLEDAPDTPPRFRRVRKLSDYEVMLSWQPPLEANSDILHYVIRVWNETFELWNNVTETSLVLHLEYESYYNATAASWTRLGDGGVRSFISFTTAESEPLDPPQNMSFTNITVSSLTVLWKPPSQPNGVIEYYTIYYSENNTVAEQRVPVSDLPVSAPLDFPLSYTLTGLIGGTEYTLWMTSSTSQGDGGVQSEPQNVVLPEDVPSDPVQNLSAQVLSSTAVVISWDPPLEPNGRPQYLVTLQEAGVPPDGTGPGTPTVNKTITQTTRDTVVLFTRLRKYFPYVVTVIPGTGAGLAYNQTNMQYLRTDDDIPSSPPLMVATRNVSSSSIAVVWQSPLEANGEITEYTLALSGPGVTNTTQTSNTSVILSNLLPYTAYNLTITAATRRGAGPPLLLQLHTDEGGPMSPPYNLTVYNHTAVSVWLSWEPPLEPNGVVLQYGFRIRDLITHTVTNKNSSGPSTTEHLSGFRPHSSYEISVYTFTKVGHGNQFSSPVTFTTTESVSNAVGNLSCSGLGWDSILLSWEVPTNPNGQIISYEVTVDSEWQTFTHQAHSTDYTVTGLSPNQWYSLTVAAVNSAGPGDSVNCTASTLSESAPGAPRYLTVTMVTPSNVTLLWTAPMSVPGLLKEYLIISQLLSTVCDTNIQPTVLPGTEDELSPDCVDSNATMSLNASDSTPQTLNSITFQSLSKYRRYRFKVAAVTNAGVGEYTPWSYVQTLIGNPDAPPHNLKVIPTSTSLRITWDPPLVLSGPTSYLVQVDGPDVNISTVRAPEELMTIFVTNLTAFTQYNVTIIAFTGPLVLAATDGKAIGPIEFLTLEEEPKDPPKNVTVSVIPGEVNRVEVTFSPPESPNGNITAYFVYIYEKEELVKNISLNILQSDNNILTAVIDGLKGGHNYSIQISARNGAGRSPPSPHVSISTGITAPAKPTQIPKLALFPGGAAMVTHRTITIHMPVCFYSDDNGPITKIQVIVAESGVKDIQNVTMWKNAFFGPPAPYLTDRGFPNPPCPAGDRVLRPGAHIRADGIVSGDYYVIGENDDCKVTNTEDYCNGPLKPSTVYVFKFRGTTVNGQYTDSDYSDQVKTQGEGLLTRDEQIILGVLLSFFLGVLLITIICLSVKLHQRKKEVGTYSPREAEIIETKYKLDQLIAVADLELKQDKINRYSSSFFFRRKEIYVIQLLSYRKSLKPINKKSFLQHVEDLCASENTKFQEEFAELPKLLQDLATSDADLPWNKSKNRFPNIKPYNNNRVKLLSEPGTAGSDYINASFVSGYLCPTEFIATQGPLPGTVADFWRMIWETGTRTIAMLTQCFEKGRIRCHKYWPEDNKPMSVFSDILISKVSEEVFPDWTVRTLRVEKHGHYILVRHFNYTSWPEHGVPESCSTFIKFVKAVRAHRHETNSTIAVHCSAGVGRTGVFIALDHLIQHVRDHDFVDVYGLVAELRSERMCMVQNLAQYIFLHQSTLELLNNKGNSQSIWFVSYSALEKMDSLDAMEGDVELEWEETTM